MKLESFWTDTASSFEGRTDALPGRVDVAVVGGGFTGLSAAHALARRGARVAVLEAGKVAAEGFALLQLVGPGNGVPMVRVCAYAAEVERIRRVRRA